MAPTRILAKLLVLALAFVALFVPSALAAEGISPAKSLGGARVKTTATAAGSDREKTGGSVSSGGSKEVLAISTVKPGNGTTVSATIGWEVAVTAGAPTKVEFLVDGAAKFSDSSAPYGGSLDTTKLSNGNHTLSATAYGSKGVKATTSVTVKVSNTTSTPAPEPTPEPAPAPEPTPAPEAGGAIYWGATIGTHLTGGQPPWDMGAVTKFEEETKKKVSMVNFFQPFANCNPGCSFYSFPAGPLENIRLHGSIPVLSWSSQSIPSTKNEPDFQLSDVISGRYDAYIREFATKAKAWGHPFMLRFNWEMNGKWFPWHEGVNGNQPGEFVTSWRHVHDIFKEVGATNVTWVWCPNVDYYGATSLASVYPGDAYVDWTGLDGYNRGTNPVAPEGWKSFSQVYRSSYNAIAGSIAPSKPLMVGEVASSEIGGSKSAWIKDMLTRVPTEFPKIRALLYFDKYDSSMDWPLETSTGAVSAFAEGVQGSTYLGNTFSSLSATKILPLG
ncbi:MAG TPA: glycosyl hydrolase [Solirubrobacterales bacterium]|nr:glycosyl hydrolase [Solirubrobacterales bacterium]